MGRRGLRKLWLIESSMVQSGEAPSLFEKFDAHPQTISRGGIHHLVSRNDRLPSWLLREHNYYLFLPPICMLYCTKRITSPAVFLWETIVHTTRFCIYDNRREASFQVFRSTWYQLFVDWRRLPVIWLRTFQPDLPILLLFSDGGLLSSYSFLC